MSENGDINTEKVVSLEAVRQRILDVSEELFCEKGFDGTTIRDITRDAGCNLAAVNYHFQNKENLYKEAFKHHLVQLKDLYIVAAENVMNQPQENIKIEILLRSFSSAMVELLIGKNKPQRFITLMTREMLDPHLPPNVFYDELMLPVQTIMETAIRKIYPQITDKQLMFSLLSLVGQLIHIVRFTEFAQRGGIQNLMYDMNELIEHTVNFTAAGIREMINENPESRSQKSE